MNIRINTMLEQATHTQEMWQYYKVYITKTLEQYILQHWVIMYGVGREKGVAYLGLGSLYECLST